MLSKKELAASWLPRYLGLSVDEVGDFVLLTNFTEYLRRFCLQYDMPMPSDHTPMQSATSPDGITMIKFGMGTANAATVMDLLSARMPKGILFLGKCGGLKSSVEIGHFILPIAAIRGEGTGDDYLPREVPALPSFRLHKDVSLHLNEHEQNYRTGVIYTTNRRLWEWDDDFRAYLKKISVIGIDMEVATLFITGHANAIPRGALLLVSDLPMVPEGIKTEESDRAVNKSYLDLHLKLGIESAKSILRRKNGLKHFLY